LLADQFLLYLLVWANHASESVLLVM